MKKWGVLARRTKTLVSFSHMPMGNVRSYHQHQVYMKAAEDEDKYAKKKQNYEEQQSVVKVFFDYKQFLIGGTFSIFGDLLKYREMRKEISYRPFRVASRKEMLFMNGFRFDFVKLLIPATCIFMYPKLLLAYLPLCYYYPSIRPSYYQSDSLKKAIRENGHQMRTEQRDMIIQELLRQTSMLTSQQELQDQIALLHSVIQKINLLKFHNLPIKLLPNLDSILKDLKQLDQSELFNEYLTIDKLSDNVIDGLCRFSFVARLIFNGISGTYRVTNSGSIVGSRSGGLESNIHSLKYMLNHLFMGASASNTPFIRSMMPIKYKKKLLKYYLQLIRHDDHFIHQVLDTMSLKEMLEASYVRGFVHDWKFNDVTTGKTTEEDTKQVNPVNNPVVSREAMVRYFKVWCEFSSSVQNDNLLLLATVLLFIH